jgi:hypothetical protein
MRHRRRRRRRRRQQQQQQHRLTSPISHQLICRFVFGGRCEGEHGLHAVNEPGRPAPKYAM